MRHIPTFYNLACGVIYAEMDVATHDRALTPLYDHVPADAPSAGVRFAKDSLIGMDAAPIGKRLAHHSLHVLPGHPRMDGRWSLGR
jgi:hypothetical protein